MQAEIDAEGAAAVEVLGVNAAGQEAGNATMVAGRALPLLQDVASVDAWGLWDVTARDVVVVDPFGRAHAVYNLTGHDLAVPANYAALKQLLLDAAAAAP
jgi:hypothetical protein